MKNVRTLILGIAACVLLFTIPASGLHTPQQWYDTQKNFDDKDGNGVEDAIDELMRKDPLQTIDVFFCFLNDCRPDALVSEIQQTVISYGGSIGYASDVISTLVVKGIRVKDVICFTATSVKEIGYVHLDHIMVPHMATAGAALKAHAGLYSPNTAEDLGYDGSGISIAVLDTGCDDPGGPGVTHNDLPAGVSAPGVGGLFIDASSNLAFGNPDDQQGHGTAVAGCALGRGGISGNRGVAWQADLFDCRITGPGTSGSTSTSNIQQVVDWLTWNHNSVVPPVRVANISFGSSTPSSGNALTYSIEALVASGVVTCVSAGNNDSCAGTGIGSIAVATRAITVAAATHNGTVDRGNDTIANYSTIGPGIGASAKPDITGYGNQCTMQCPQFCQSGTNADPIQAPNLNSATGYTDFGGTSAASPMVAGGAALLIQLNPAITPPAVKSLLMNTAEDKGPVGWDSTWGAGLMDLGPTFAGPPPSCDLKVKAVTYSPATVQCYQPVTITIEVENVGSVAVTNFVVDWERWYFGPSQPAMRYPIGSGPTANSAGALLPGGTRLFSRTWTPGVSDNLPLSQHSCFWGIVSASCDDNASNNEKNRNVNIIGVTAAYTCSPPAPMNFTGKIVFPFRIGHNERGTTPILLKLVNPDPDFQVDIDVDNSERISPDEVLVNVDNQSCAVWGNLIINTPSTGAPLKSLPIMVYAIDYRNQQPIGDFEVVVDLTDRDQDGVPDVDDNCPNVYNPPDETGFQPDIDQDRFGDVCDNCPEISNPDQKVSNGGDGLGNVCNPLCDLPSDLDDDCDGDLHDFAIFAQYWLEGVQ